MLEGPDSRWFRFGMALVGLGVSLALDQFVPSTAMPPLALCAILIVAWFGGLGPGLALLTASILIAAPRLTSPGQQLRLVAYAADAVLFMVIVAWFWRERHRAEAEAGRRLETESRYRMLFEQTPDPLWVVDRRSLAILECNEAATRQYGHARAEFLDLTLNDLRAEGRSPLGARAGRDEPPPSGIVGHRRKDGSAIDVELTSRPFQGSGAEADALLVLGRDVSERQEAEAERDRARQEAEAANRAKDKFLAVLSHELRTPLTPVMLACSALLDGPGEASPAESRQALEMIRRNVELTSRLVNDLLDVTRIARGKMALVPHGLSLHELIRETIQICESDLRASGARLDVQLDATRDRVEGDPARLQQVFWNLIKNAVKFTPAGGTILVRTLDGPPSTTGPGPGSIIAEIVDDGAGLASEALGRIFDPFHQEHPVGGGGSRGGLGLGLVITRGIVDAHGGRISATSEGLGRGASFRLELPTAPDEAPEAGTNPSPETPEPQAAEPARGLRILAVDDHADTVRVIASLLERAGHRVRSAGSIRAAREAVLAEPFDLLLCDIGLTDGSGIELMRELAGTGLKGIALSGYGAPGDVTRSLEAGFAAHLTKPIRWDELVRQIDAAIARP